MIYLKQFFPCSRTPPPWYLYICLKKVAGLTDTLPPGMHTFSIPVLTMYKIEGGQVHTPHQSFNQNPVIDPRTPDTPVPPGVHTLAITPPKCIGGGGGV